MSLEAHKVSHTAMERSNLLACIKQESGWSVSELAERLSMKQPVVSKLLSYQRLAPALKEQLHSGQLDTERASSSANKNRPSSWRSQAKSAR